MLTEDQILEVEQYCSLHQISKKQRLDELSINPNEYYRLKRKMISQSNDLSSGKFLQMTPSGNFTLSTQSPLTKRKKSVDPGTQVSFLTIEVRNERGSAMRIQGDLSVDQLREIMTIM